MLHSVKIVGEVIRSEEIKDNHSYNLGISFVRINEDGRNALIKFIDEHICDQQ